MKVKMMGSSRLFQSAAICVLAILSASCLGGGSTPKELLTLTPAQVLPAGESRSAGAGEVIAVLAPTVPRSINTRRIPVYVNPITIEYLVGATYIEEPHQLFRRVLAETIAARTGRLVLDPGNFTQEAGATLSGQMLQYGFEPATMQVVIAYEATLSRGTDSLLARRFESRVPVTAQTAAVIAPALNQAANQVAQQVADWIGG
jgi:cholesterol transport system auxiliary component